MSAQLCFTVRFLQPCAHGRDGHGEPEWPPSPLRHFQALVAAAAALWNERMRLEYAVPALRWLERQPPPTLLAARGCRSRVKYRLYVPDNVTDQVATSWAAGREASMADFRTEKDVCPTHLRGEAVHYLFPLPSEGCPDFEVLSAAARSITHLGWGVDMVAGSASLLSEEEAAQLISDPGVTCWRPSTEGGTLLRVPVEGTLRALIDKHSAFLTRLDVDTFRPVPPLTCFATVGYRCDTDRSPHPFSAFSILQPDASRYRTFETLYRARDIAGYVRHVLATLCADWPFGDVGAFIHGHDRSDSARPLKGENADQRFAYLPLPTINFKLGRVESIRRLLIVAPPGFQDRLDWVRRRLPGQELFWEGKPIGLLNILPTSDWVLRQYIEEARVWSTVTPVIVPGHTDRSLKKGLRLFQNCLDHAGFPPTLRDLAHIEWRTVGFRPGVEHASRYRVASHQEVLPRYHVRISWPVPVQGPLCLGAGRYYGMGLFAREGNS